MTPPSTIWKGRTGWGAGGFAAGAAAMAAVWTVVGVRTPPEPYMPTEVILPYRSDPAPDPGYARPLVQAPPEGSAARPLESTAIDNRLAAVPVDNDPPAADPQPAAPAADPPAPGNQPTVGLHLINLNTASAAELDLLPGIGPALAGRIIDERERGGRFTSLQDFQRVRGIGPRTAEKLEGLVSFE